MSDTITVQTLHGYALVVTRNEASKDRVPPWGTVTLSHPATAFSGTLGVIHDLDAAYFEAECVWINHFSFELPWADLLRLADFMSLPIPMPETAA